MNHQSIIPTQNHTHRLDDYTLMVIEAGSGLFEIDFRNYHFSSGKGLFLNAGQYFRLVTGDVEISLYQFEGDLVQQKRDSRYLFKHLVSLGYINLDDSKEAIFQKQGGVDEDVLLENSINRWIGLNPFGAPRTEVDLLFDVKEYIDLNYRKTPTVEEVAKTIGTQAPQIRKVTKKRLEITVNKLNRQKLLLESQRQIAFTQSSTKEVAYELGFAYPSYFNRFFKENTSLTPRDFRDKFNYKAQDTFASSFTELLEDHFKTERFMGFYADKLNLSAKTLGRKLQASFGKGFHSLLASKLVDEVKTGLQKESSVTDIAFSLGFKEPNHLSAFFKKHTGVSPSAFVV